MSIASAHKFDPSILRAYDIRGVVGETLDVTDALALGKSFGTVVRRRGGQTVALGWDGRDSSPDLVAALGFGLAWTGLKVVRIGLGPTPMLYFAVHVLEADGGVMVTGSHNPPGHNGFKLMLDPRGDSAAFYGDDIQRLGKMAADVDLEFTKAPGTAEDRPVQADYVARLLEEYGAGDGLDVVWDCGNGATGNVVRALIARLPGTHTGLFMDVDGRFPNHHPDPTVPENLIALQQAVGERGADLGVAFDGDGDRLGVVDETGAILWADQLMVLFAEDVIAAQPGATVIADVKASQVLFDAVAAAGGRPEMFKTGHSLIKDRMKQVGAPFAGEMSGHLFFADRYFGFDDGLYAAVRLIRLLAQSGRSLADFRRSLPAVVNTPEIRLDCPDDRKFIVIEEIQARAAAAGLEVNDIDGLRVTTADGWWLLRASNTQPALVARCEAADAAGLERLKQAVAEELATCGLALPEVAV